MLNLPAGQCSGVLHVRLRCWSPVVCQEDYAEQRQEAGKRSLGIAADSCFGHPAHARWDVANRLKTKLCLHGVCSGWQVWQV